MNDQKLRDAIEQCKYNVEDGDEDIRILVACAEAVLAVTGLPEKIEVNLHKCVICGADQGLHCAEGEYCPRNGIEAVYPCKQEWSETVFTTNSQQVVINKIIDDFRAVIAAHYVPKEEYEKVKAKLEEWKGFEKRILSAGNLLPRKINLEGVVMGADDLNIAEHINRIIMDCQIVVAKHYVPLGEIKKAKKQMEKVKAENERLTNVNNLFRNRIADLEAQLNRIKLNKDVKDDLIEQQCQLIADMKFQFEAQLARRKLTEKELTKLIHSYRLGYEHGENNISYEDCKELAQAIVNHQGEYPAQGKLTEKEIKSELFSHPGWFNNFQVMEMSHERLCELIAQAIVAAQEKRGK